MNFMILPMIKKSPLKNWTTVNMLFMYKHANLLHKLRAVSMLFHVYIFENIGRTLNKS